MSKWEFQDSEVEKIKKCPCGKGYYISTRKTYEDDYSKEHVVTDKEITCIECRAIYEYYNGKWVTKENHKKIREMENTFNELEKQLYKRFYNEKLHSILKYLKTKKGVYDFLFKNKLFNVPGTVQTFYKNGIEYYISNGNFYYSLKDFVKLVELTVGLFEVDKSQLSNIEKSKKEIEDFVEIHSVESAK